VLSVSHFTNHLQQIQSQRIAHKCMIQSNTKERAITHGRSKPKKLVGFALQYSQNTKIYANAQIVSNSCHLLAHSHFCFLTLLLVHSCLYSKLTCSPSSHSSATSSTSILKLEKSPKTSSSPLWILFFFNVLQYCSRPYKLSVSSYDAYTGAQQRKLTFTAALREAILSFLLGLGGAD
jgi:hypothetical protein